MSAELIRQKELETLHRQRLLAADPLSLHPGLPPDHPALRSVHDVPEGHALRDELSRRNAMLVLRHNNAPLLSLTPGGPGAATTPPKEQPRRAGSGRKPSQARAEPQGPGEPREAAEPRARDGAQDCNDEEMKDSESDAEAGEDKAEGLKAEGGSGAELKECKDGAGKACEGSKEPGEAGTAPSGPCSSSSADSPSHLLGPGIGKAEVKYLPPASLPAPQPLPFGFPYTMSPYFHAGEALGMCWVLGGAGTCLAGLGKGISPCSLHGVVVVAWSASLPCFKRRNFCVEGVVRHLEGGVTILGGCPGKDGCGTRCSGGTVGIGQRLNSMTLEGFSRLGPVCSCPGQGQLGSGVHFCVTGTGRAGREVTATSLSSLQEQGLAQRGSQTQGAQPRTQICPS